MADMGDPQESPDATIIHDHPFEPRGEWWTLCKHCGLARASHTMPTEHEPPYKKPPEEDPPTDKDEPPPDDEELPLGQTHDIHLFDGELLRNVREPDRPKKLEGE